jgi:PIN domain nuclease of toxin-antitoxin system
VRLLLDTHVLLWWLSNPSELADGARGAIAAPESTVVVSAASAWEIAIKKARGKLQAPDDLEVQLDRHGFARLSITVTHALRAGALPPHHSDPFDRVLVAQAELEGLTLVTRDARIAHYGVAVLPA